MTRVAIALGSNIDAESNLVAAVRKIAELSPVLKASTVWESAPFGYSEQANFLNAAVLIETSLSPHQLKGELLRIERELGRVRDPRNKNGPRTIDLDIALFGEQVISEGEIQIPDPEIPHRSFLAIPLAEIPPLTPHPVSGKLLAVLARPFRGATELTPRREIDLLESAKELPSAR